MTLFVGQHAPNFNSFAIMPDGSFNMEFNLDNYRAGRMLVVFFYPMNFSQVSTTELIALNKRYAEFEKRGVAVVAISTDSQLSHQLYRTKSPEEGGCGSLYFPLVPDMNRAASKIYDVLVSDTMALGGTFIMDEMGVIRMQQVHDLPVGRDIDSILNFIDAFKHHMETGNLTPANWKKGQPDIDPADDFGKQYLAANAKSL